MENINFCSESFFPDNEVFCFQPASVGIMKLNKYDYSKLTL